MKLRKGFVSNSSSSSFIIKLDKPIEKYTLEEFRSVCQSHGKVFDPVEVLYNDLMNTEESKREIPDWSWAYDVLGRQLEANEYIVEYEDHTEEGSYMEHDFVGYLPITEYSINMPTKVIPQFYHVK